MSENGIYTREQFEIMVRDMLEEVVTGDKPDGIRMFFCTCSGRIPEDCDGLHDRTYGWHFLTTILKTLQDEALPLLAKCWLPVSEARTACKVVLKHDIPENTLATWIKAASDDAGRPKVTRIDPADAARRELVKACKGAIEAVKAMMAHETDQVMQHQLRSLIGELQWCVREYGQKTEDLK